MCLYLLAGCRRELAAPWLWLQVSREGQRERRVRPLPAAQQPVPLRLVALSHAGRQVTCNWVAASLRSFMSALVPLSLTCARVCSLQESKRQGCQVEHTPTHACWDQSSACRQASMRVCPGQPGGPQSSWRCGLLPRRQDIHRYSLLHRPTLLTMCVALMS